MCTCCCSTLLETQLIIRKVKRWSLKYYMLLKIRTRGGPVKLWAFSFKQKFQLPNSKFTLEFLLGYLNWFLRQPACSISSRNLIMNSLGLLELSWTLHDELSKLNDDHNVAGRWIEMNHSRLFIKNQRCENFKFRPILIIDFSS